METSDIKTLLELSLCYFDEMKQLNKNEDITIYDKKYYMKALFNAIVRHTAIKNNINFRYGLSRYKIKICLICNKKFDDLDVCRVPKCEHLFHAECICSLENKDINELKCPICKCLL